MKQSWKSGDIFLVPNSDGKFTPGQVIGHEKRTLHSASCAFFDQRVASIEEGRTLKLDLAKCFSALLITPESLNHGSWDVIANEPVVLPRKLWPYEAMLSQGEKNGPKVRGSGLVDAFLDAYYRLRPWDSWYRSDYLDEFLLSPDKKPNNLILVK